MLMYWHLHRKSQLKNIYKFIVDFLYRKWFEIKSWNAKYHLYAHYLHFQVNYKKELSTTIYSEIVYNTQFLGYHGHCPRGVECSKLLVGDYPVWATAHRLSWALSEGRVGGVQQVACGRLSSLGNCTQVVMGIVRGACRWSAASGLRAIIQSGQLHTGCHGHCPRGV